MTNRFQLRCILNDLHIHKEGLRPIPIAVQRKRRKSYDFAYHSEFLGNQVLSGAVADELISLGWCKVVALDADIEYLATTEKGRDVLAQHRAWLDGNPD